MKKSLILITLLLLTSCGDQVKEEKQVSVNTENEVNTGIINNVNISTGIINTGVILNEKKEEKVDSLIENKVNFSNEEINEILEKIDKNKFYFFDNNKSTIKQGNFEAKYIKSNDYEKYIDKININISGKTYIIPGIYGENDIKKYPECLTSWSGSGVTLEQVKNICGSKFRSLIDFSPSGYYLSVAYHGFDYSGIKLLNTKNGEEILDIIEASFIGWTKDKKQFIYGQESGMGGESGLYITINGDFPKIKEITHDSISGGHIDDKYVYVKTSLANPIYLKVFDIKTLKQVFTKKIN